MIRDPAGAGYGAMLHKRCRMHARRRGRAPTDFGSRCAEGATAPETLRQKDCGRQGALESGGRDIPAVHRRSKPRPLSASRTRSGRDQVNLSG